MSAWTVRALPDVVDLGVAALQAAVLLALAWAAAAMLRRSSAAARHTVWTFGVVSALVVPWLGLVVPTWTPVAPAPVSSAPAFVLPTWQPAAAAVAEPGGLSALVGWWAVGAALVALRVLRAHGAAWRIGRSAVPVTEPGWRAVHDEVAAQLGVAVPVELGRSAQIAGPMTLGLLRPRVLLPASAEDWSADRRRAVLLHELGHVRRGDLGAQAAAQVLCVLHWFNPLAWWAASRLAEERELAADDLVVGAGMRPSSYADDLVQIARTLTSTPAVAAACMAERSTTRRVLRILDPSAPRAPLSRRAWWGLGAVVVAVTAGTSALGDTGTDTGVDGLRGTVTVGPVGYLVREGEVAPPLTPADLRHFARVQASIRDRIDGLARCYDRRLAERPDLAGEVGLHWEVAAFGAYEHGCMNEGHIEDPELLRCVNLLMESGYYPHPPDADRELLVTFGFSAE